MRMTRLFLLLFIMVLILTNEIFGQNESVDHVVYLIGNTDNNNPS